MCLLRNKVFCLLFLVPAAVFAQTNCDEGAGPLNPAQPAGITPEEIIQNSPPRKVISSRSWRITATPATSK